MGMKVADEGQFIGWIESVDGPPLSKGLQGSGELQSSHVTMGMSGNPLPQKEIIGYGMMPSDARHYLVNRKMLSRSLSVSILLIVGVLMGQANLDLMEGAKRLEKPISAEILRWIMRTVRGMECQAKDTVS